MEWMQSAPPGGDEELIDYLIAVSVIAKRLAQRLSAEKKPPAAAEGMN